MVKVWYVPPNVSPIGVPELRSINLLDFVLMGAPKLQPSLNQRLDAKMQPEPNNYKLVRNLLLDQMTVVTIK